ncbi:MAG TPA: cell division ATP-binding protein FtsE [Bacteroidota bacterium]|jgi:cell division transport system ATP-binding protein|nr:cell division ATP-binding protein FtsE [Bacteroidota bacterium]
MIELKNVWVSFDNQPVLENVNFSLNQGEFVYLVGQTGAGKSSLLRLLYFDLFPDRGFVKVANYSSNSISQRQIPYLRRKIGIIFQDFKLLNDRNAYENVAFALYVTNTKRKEIKKKVLLTLADVGLSHKRYSMPHELSGGEQQRVVIARALANDPIMLIADEPTGNLDPTSSFEIMDLLRKINLRGTAILMATHNYDLVKKYPARVIQLQDGTLSNIDPRKLKA